MRSNYFKLICNGNIVDVFEHPQYFRVLDNGQVILSSSVSANGVVGPNNTLYLFKETSKLTQDHFIGALEPITEAQYNFFRESLNKQVIAATEDYAILKARQAKIEELSNDCQRAICAGVTVRLLDDIDHSFEFTIEDQINLLQLENMLNAGAESVIYHAAGEPCRIFSKQDMLRVIKAFRSHVTYHTTYFNAIKQFVMSLTKVKDIEFVYYGMNVANAIDNSLIRDLLIARSEAL